jgi:hypothetical protein
MSTPNAPSSASTTDDAQLEERIEKLERVYETELQSERQRRKELED